MTIIPYNINMTKPVKKTQKIYSLTKKREYTNLLNQKLRFLRNLEVDRTIYRSAAREMIQEVRKLDESEAMFLPVVSIPMRKKVLDKVTVNTGTIVRGRFLRTIKTMWNDVYSLGKRHAVTDLLMNTGLFDNQFKRSASFHSIEGVTLLDLLPDEDVAEFAESEDLTPAQRKAIGRAKRNLTILRNNVRNLKASGTLYDDFNLEESTGKAARLTIEQRIIFLEMVQEIDDLLRKAEASEKNFLSDEYLQRRYRVLTQDYADMYDNYIKEQMASYLDKNIEGVRQILNKEADAEQLVNRISTQIENAQVELVKPNVKAEMILRTELGLAYNFGKLLGFTSPTDLSRKFRWNADWELEGKADYEVCKACQRMDGRIYTVQDLLTVGTRLDRGVLNYQGQTRTDFKNPTMPMIPFHPNCSCYWTLMPDDDPAEDYAERYVDTNIPPPLPPIPGTREDVEKLQDQTIPITVASGLLVGGLFLLARSNVWRLFYRTAVQAVDDVVKPTTTQQLIDVSKFIIDEVPEEVVTRYKDILDTTIRTAPEELPTIVEPVLTRRVTSPV